MIIFLPIRHCQLDPHLQEAEKSFLLNYNTFQVHLSLNSLLLMFRHIHIVHFKLFAQIYFHWGLILFRK